MTLLHRLHQWSLEAPQQPAQRFKDGDGWQTISAAEYCQRVFHLALFIESKGFTADDVGTIFSYNCPAWVHSELAFALLGGKSAGFYPNLSTYDLHYILAETRAKVIAVQNQEYYNKITEQGRRSLPEHIELVIVFEGDSALAPQAVSYEQALAAGSELARGKELGAYLQRLQPQAGSFLIYTSGTTGNPKGVLLTHDNFTFTSDTIIDYLQMDPSGGGSTFSFLPLCHIAEKLQNLGIGLSCRYLVNYCSQFENFLEDLQTARPTLFFAVPRVWEKMREGVLDKLEQSRGVKKRLGLWALGIGAQMAAKTYRQQQPSPWLTRQYCMADRLVLAKIRKGLGLEQARWYASGASSLAPHVIEWFRGIGIEIIEVFGQSESTGVICSTRPGMNNSVGTVGLPLPGIEFQLADDGEIITRGPHVFCQYYNNPEATAETVKDGWLHTGDLGEKTSGGWIRIRGRKKEIIKTSGGKMVAPVPIESLLKQFSKVSQACMVGDSRKYLTALITLSPQVVAKLDPSQDYRNKFVVDAPELLLEFQEFVDKLNRTLACYAQIKYFTLLANDFTVETGELTPTMKLKRSAIEARYHNVIDEMYLELEQRERAASLEECPLLCSPETCICSKVNPQIAS